MRNVLVIKKEFGLWFTDFDDIETYWSYYKTACEILEEIERENKAASRKL